MMDLLFANVTAVTMTGDAPVLKNAYLGVTGGKISYLSQQPPNEPAQRTLDKRHWVVMPGLVNAHTHLPMTLLRGYADDMALQSWLFDRVFPVEAKMTREDIGNGTMLALAEAAAAGVVSFTEMYTHIDAIAACVAQTGFKVNLSCGVTNFAPQWSFDESSDIRQMREALDRWHGHDDGRIVIDASLHAEYTSSPDIWRQVAAFAAEKGLRMHVHVSETQREHDECVAKHGRTPTAALADCGVFDVPATVAHGVWLTDDDMALLAAKHATVAHCPASNAKLASGIARLDAMEVAGLNVALGSDGMASHNAMDLFADMKLASLLQKARSLDPTLQPARRCLEMATVNGAMSQGRQTSGRLAVGQDADLAVLDFDKPHLTPCFDVLSHLVYAARASDVVMTLVRGRAVYDNGRLPTIDWERVTHSVAHDSLRRLYQV